MADQNPPTAADAPRQGDTLPVGQGAVALKRLTDKVYRLLLAELRLEQARGERDRPRRS